MAQRHETNTYQKQQTITSMCAIATGGAHSAVQGRAFTPAWIVGGDLNVDAGTMGLVCNDYVEASVPCVSLPGWPCDYNAQKADFARSQGIDITQVHSWVGVHSKPCASDIYDVVVVMGSVKAAAPLIDSSPPPSHLPNACPQCPVLAQRAIF